MDHTFANDVKKGLTANPKQLPSKYFYNAEGDRLFKEITRMKDYYLTRAEEEILEEQSKDMLTYFQNGGTKFNMIELGPGDGVKSHLLLDHFARNKAEFDYYPVDISANVLRLLESNIGDKLPEVKIHSLNLDYFEALNQFHKMSETRNVVLFLGSNIGNFSEEEAVGFLKSLNEKLSPKDLLLLGVDLKKEGKIILNAYNDKDGITRDFNLNYLKRINDELGGDFVLEYFRHTPEYDESIGAAKSYLTALKDHTVNIRYIDLQVPFAKGEKIFMEISQKYDQQKIEDLAKQTGFRVVRYFNDKRKYFTDVIWEKV